MSASNLIQGSQEWLEFRRLRVCASDIPIIIGKSKWCTKYLLWQRKLGFVPEQKQNFAMTRGNQLESIVRDLVNLDLDSHFRPEVVVHEELEWAAASLDGIDKQKRAILEIKCPGLADHTTAEEGEIPIHYYPQVQWQLFCSNLKTCYYASYFNDTVTTIKVKRDDNYIAKELLPQASEFYKCLIEMREPEIGENDYVQITAPGFELAANQWKVCNELRKTHELKEKHYKNEMVKFTDDSNCRGYGVKLTRVGRDGAIDYAGMLEAIQEKYPGVEKEFPIADYQKPQIGYWKVSQDKGS